MLGLPRIVKIFLRPKPQLEIQYLILVSFFSIINIATMNNKHRKVLEKIFQNPVKPIEWQDIEKLSLALGAKIAEGSGSRVTSQRSDC